MQQTTFVLTLAVALAAAGCSSMRPAAMPAKLAEAAASQAGPSDARVAVAKAKPIGPPPEKTEQEAMAEVAPLLAEIAAEDPALHAEVLEQLSGTTPRLWSLTVQRAQNTLALKKELAAESTPTTQVAQQDAAASKIIQASATVETQPLARPELPTVVGGEPPAPAIKNLFASVEAPPKATPVTPPAEPPVEPMEDTPKTWREHLSAAIEKLDKKAATKPRSKREAYERVRLQLLQLAAGDTDAAVASTPGLTSAEQGYWSNQLYALSTLLDDKGADFAATADEAARHQAEASAKLRAMGTLRVLNFVTCEDVYGYGAYEPLSPARYAPGDKAILYAEIDNYHSEATSEGYSTRLASSYRLVDRHGDEVAAADFPVIDDLCLTRRRDFHIQYELTLPAGLAAGEYTLELAVNDRLGDKIGHAEAPLTISIGGADRTARVW